jgi:hypothetical protein
MVGLALEADIGRIARYKHALPSKSINLLREPDGHERPGLNRVAPDIGGFARARPPALPAWSRLVRSTIRASPRISARAHQREGDQEGQDMAEDQPAAQRPGHYVSCDTSL